VGDVTGHGLLAARTMGKVRFFLRALLMNVQRPSQLLRAASELLVAEHSDELATCAVVLWNRAAGTLQVATAGNLAPLVADHRGVRFVELTPLPPLGVVRHDTPDEVDVLVALTSPAQLLMFTDGLVERRDDVIDDSLEELRQLIEAAGGTAQQVVENVLAPLLSTASDDVAVLCADLRPGGHAD
ncbi:MAG TPA: PP2C family protein-serine/threonine phosphatase, partial [Ilumatobacteraceae bacterium]|nr:PP2C family protein-serine/threonine phosphatase [Ilumatobacteraceae bacterium]